MFWKQSRLQIWSPRRKDINLLFAPEAQKISNAIKQLRLPSLKQKGDNMAHCDFIGTCPFLNEKIMTMPLTACVLVENFCDSCFDKCAIHNFAMTDSIDNVPKHVCPDDTYELSDEVVESVLLGRVGW
jgi:hypothetical protein